MLGLLFNTFKRTDEYLTEISDISNFFSDYFGTSTTDYTVPQNTTITGDTLLKVSDSLSFRNLTVPATSSIVTTPVYGARTWTETYYVTTNVGWRMKRERVKTETTDCTKGPFSPLIIKCSGKLTIAGSINADGNGGLYSYGGLKNAQISAVPFDVPNTNGQSTTFNTFTRLYTTGAAGTFFKFDSFLCGGGGCGEAANASANFGISAGGGRNSGTTIAGNYGGGGGGGFIAIYYNKLIINGKEYGKDPGCEVWRIHANGVGGITGTANVSAGGKGGGMLIISARTLEITGNGRISADGACGANRPGLSYGILNNVPQLGLGQNGHFWNQAQQRYIYGMPANRTYYYDDGTGNGLCNQSLAATSGNFCGGAGLCLGFKVGDK